MSEDREIVEDEGEQELDLEDQETEGGDEPVPDEEEGLEGDEGDDGGEEEQRGEVRREPRPGRRERDAARLRREREERAAERAAYEARLAALERNQQRPVFDTEGQARAEREELARIAQLPWEEQIAAFNQRTERRTAAALGNIQARNEDLLDQMRFERLQETAPAARRLAAEVERQMADGRARGIQGLTRVAVYKYLRGDEVDKKEQSALGRQRRAGRANVRRETTRPGVARSAAGAARRQTDNSIEAVTARLRGKVLGEDI